ncbi:hypothetical protein [Nocardia cerradoensis]|nr:hypothetical protein [Nocardia cerradoensis]NKY44276.1 hypothetical protein [Nocardia cerradoensis]
MIEMWFRGRHAHGKDDRANARIVAGNANIGAVGDGNTQTNFYFDLTGSARAGSNRKLPRSARWASLAFVTVLVVFGAILWNPAEPSQGEVEPVTISVRTDPALQTGTDGMFALPNDVPSKPAAITPADIANLIKSQGGAKIDNYRAELILVGNSDSTAVVTGLRVHTVRYDPNPLGGTEIDVSSQGEGQPIQGCGFVDPQADSEVDSLSDQVAYCWEGHGGKYFAEHYVSLGRGEPAVFDIEVGWSGADGPAYPSVYRKVPNKVSGFGDGWIRQAPIGVYEWEFYVDVTVGGKPSSIVVDDNGAPFKLATSAPAYSAEYGLRYSTDGSSIARK